MIDSYMDTAEDIMLDDEAEELEDAMNELIEDDYSDIDNIAGDDYEEYDEDDDTEDYIDYEVLDDYYGGL